MRTEQELIKLYFFHVPAAMILEGQIDHRDFSQHELLELMRSYQKEYSETESSLRYQIVRNGTEWWTNKVESGANVFLALVRVAEGLLTIDANDIRCRYSSLLDWREISRYLGEELLVCAFLARRFQCTGIRTEQFFWDTVLKHTNKQLNEMMRQGISENHFHLFGSAPVFQMLWIKLMNDVDLKRYYKGLQGMDKNLRNLHVHFDQKYKESTSECMILQAALMRAVMYCFLNGKQYIFANYEQDVGGMSIQEAINSLMTGERIIEHQSEIRSKVNLLKAEAMFVRGTELDDYALEDIRDHGSLNTMFAGERKLVYQMLCDILVDKKLPEEVQKMLYPYLVIRTAIRGRLVQNNDDLGLENFLVYSSQKRDFLSGKKELDNMIKHAVLSSFGSGNLKTLEIRISPQDSYLKDAKQILEYDRLLEDEEPLIKGRFYYVYHFSKKADQDSKLDRDIEMPVLCRDHSLRRSIEQRGNEILLLRQRMPKAASRLRGIDACAQEIGCRPEVFAPMFRQLRDQAIFCEEYEVPQLRITYHVGEDFLDMADGLRAIDEAIHFLNMRSGDRLGHATVLGYCAEQWYERKHRRIVIFAQDYLDNTAWMYNKLLEFQIPDCDMIKNYLFKEYTLWYHRIYGENISERKGDIFTYYEAWKLRGDLPDLYHTGRYEPDILNPTLYYSVTGDQLEDRTSRGKIEVEELYYSYHFDRNVRRAGTQAIEIQVPTIYIKAIEQIQLKMQWQIAKKGIGIETNPSSNLAISSMRSYAEHPLMNLYNLGLRHVDHERCAQMFVSINTDDKGVFHTSLENEYALIASTAENMVDDEGRAIHSPQEVYDWLDSIRRMGNQQVFIDQNILKGVGKDGFIIGEDHII